MHVYPEWSNKWHRPLPELRGRTVEQVYPVASPQWTIGVEDGSPVVQVPAGPAARIFSVA